jgi:hypothetical protein
MPYICICLEKKNEIHDFHVFQNEIYLLKFADFIREFNM